MESYSTIIFDEHTTARVGLLDENSPVKEGVMTFDRETDEASIGMSVVFTSRKQVNDLIGQLISLKKQMTKEEVKTPFQKFAESIKKKEFDPKLAEEFIKSNPTEAEFDEIKKMIDDIFGEIVERIIKM